MERSVSEGAEWRARSAPCCTRLRRIVYTELDFEDRSWTVRDDRQSGTVSRFEATELNGCRSTFRAAPVLPSSSFSSKLLACCSSFDRAPISLLSFSSRDYSARFSSETMKSVVKTASSLLALAVIRKFFPSIFFLSPSLSVFSSFFHSKVKSCDTRNNRKPSVPSRFLLCRKLTQLNLVATRRDSLRTKRNKVHFPNFISPPFANEYFARRSSIFFFIFFMDLNSDRPPSFENGDHHRLPIILTLRITDVSHFRTIVQRPRDRSISNLCANVATNNSKKPSNNSKREGTHWA